MLRSIGFILVRIGGEAKLWPEQQYLFVVFLLRHSLSPCSQDWPGTYCVTQPGLEFGILLSQPPSAGTSGMCHHTQLPKQYLKCQFHFIFLSLPLLTQVGVDVGA